MPYDHAMSHRHTAIVIPPYRHCTIAIPPYRHAATPCLTVIPPCPVLPPYRHTTIPPLHHCHTARAPSPYRHHTATPPLPYRHTIPPHHHAVMPPYIYHQQLYNIYIDKHKHVRRAVGVRWLADPEGHGQALQVIWREGGEREGERGRGRER